MIELVLNYVCLLLTCLLKDERVGANCEVMNCDHRPTFVVRW